MADVCANSIHESAGNIWTCKPLHGATLEHGRHTVISPMVSFRSLTTQPSTDLHQQNLEARAPHLLPPSP